MTELKTMNEIYKNYQSKGIFSFLNITIWEVDNHYLDLLYHGLRSGSKKVVKFLSDMYEENGISEQNGELIANILKAKYLKNWQKLWETMNFEYNPIENYSMTELETQDPIKNYEETIKNSTNERTETGDEIDKIEGTEQNTNQVAGYDDENFTNDEKNTTEYTDRKNTRTYDNRKTNDVYNDSSKKSTSIDRELKRSGNIGITTSQQMIESERELWKWNFFDIVFDDVDRELTLCVWA